MKAVQSAVQELRRASEKVIAEMRTMGLDDTFIAQFLDDGKADDVIQTLVRRERKANR